MGLILHLDSALRLGSTMVTTFRLLVAVCVVIAIAALTAALATGETEPLVRDIVLDGAIGPSADEPELVDDQVTDAPPTGVAVEQIQPAPAIQSPTPAPEDAVGAPPAQPLAPAPPAVILVPPAADASDESEEGEPAEDDDAWGEDGESED